MIVLQHKRLVWWTSTVCPNTLYRIVEGPIKRGNRMVYKLQKEGKEDFFIYPEPHQIIPFNEIKTVIKWTKDNKVWIKTAHKWKRLEDLTRGERRRLSRFQLRAIHQLLHPVVK